MTTANKCVDDYYFRGHLFIFLNLINYFKENFNEIG